MNKGFDPLIREESNKKIAKKRGWKHLPDHGSVKFHQQDDWGDLKNSLRSNSQLYNICRDREHDRRHLCSKLVDAVVADYKSNQVTQKEAKAASQNNTFIAVSMRMLHQAEDKAEALNGMIRSVETLEKEDANWYFTSEGKKSSIVPVPQLKSFSRTICPASNPLKMSEEAYEMLK